MAQKKKKGPSPNVKETKKPRKSANQVIYMIVAVLMALLMVGPLILSFFN